MARATSSLPLPRLAGRPGPARRRPSRGRRARAWRARARSRRRCRRRGSGSRARRGPAELALGGVEGGLAEREGLGDLGRGALGAAGGAAEQHLVAGVGEDQGRERGDGAGPLDLARAEGAAADAVVEVGSMRENVHIMISAIARSRECEANRSLRNKYQ